MEEEAKLKEERFPTITEMLDACRANEEEILHVFSAINVEIQKIAMNESILYKVNQQKTDDQLSKTAGSDLFKTVYDHHEGMVRINNQARNLLRFLENRI